VIVKVNLKRVRSRSRGSATLEPRQVAFKHLLSTLQHRQQVFCGLRVVTFSAMPFDHLLLPLNQQATNLDVTPRSINALVEVLVSSVSQRASNVHKNDRRNNSN
jgi:hypothetical protein